MIDFFKKLMEQALDLELTVRFTKRDGEWFAALGDELDSLSLEELGYGEKVALKELWTGETGTADAVLSAAVAPHACVVYAIESR